MAPSPRAQYIEALAAFNPAEITDANGENRVVFHHPAGDFVFKAREELPDLTRATNQAVVPLTSDPVLIPASQYRHWRDRLQRTSERDGQVFIVDRRLGSVIDLNH